MRVRWVVRRVAALAALAALAGCKGEEKESGGESGGESAADSVDSIDSGDSVDSGDSGATTDPERYQVILDVATRALTRTNATGASISVLEGRKITWVGAVGTAVPGQAVEIDEDTLFQIGSDTKKITALALLQQIEAGRADLDDTVADRLPGFGLDRSPGWAEGATLHHLISHQGGLNDWLTWYGSSDDGDLQAFTYGDYAATAFANNPGGALYNYGNPNFSIAGAITESLDGRPWVDLVEEDILSPLGMTRTFGRKTDAEAAGNYAESTGILTLEANAPGVWDPDVDYTWGDATMADLGDAAWLRPAGMLWSTPSDQLRLADWLLHGSAAGQPEILSEEGRARFAQGYVEMYPSLPVNQYGYGLIFYQGFSAGIDYYAVPLVCHGGNTLTMTSLFCMLPEQDFAISILSNGYGDDFNAVMIAAIQALVTLPAPSDPPDFSQYTIDPDDYTGEYLDPNGLGRIQISRDGDDLTVAMPDLEAAGFTIAPTLTPYYTDIFFVKIDGYDYDLTFIDGQDGTRSQYARNRQFVGTRTDVPGGPIPVDPARARLTLSRVRPL